MTSDTSSGLVGDGEPPTVAPVPPPPKLQPVFPLTGKDGHRVDDDKVDGYAEATVAADGNWTAFAHTNPTGHVFGGCSRITISFFNEAGRHMYALELANFCVGTKDGIGGPKDRQDHIRSMRPDQLVPQWVLQDTRRFAVVVSTGEKPPDWKKIGEYAETIAKVVATIYVAASAS